MLRARSARPAGAERGAPGWRHEGAATAAAAAAAAAAPGGLRTREAAGAGSAPPFPRCHSDLRCLAPSPVRGLPQSKGNFLVSRRRNNAPAREGAPRSQSLRLPRGPEAGQAAPRRRPHQGSGPVLRALPPSPPRPTFTFSHSVVLSPAAVATIQTCSLSLSSPPHPAPFLPPHPAPPPPYLPSYLPHLLSPGPLFPGLNLTTADFPRSPHSFLKPFIRVLLPFSPLSIH